MHVEHEPVQLCFGKRIRALHLDRILRREDKKWFRQSVSFAGGSNLMFLHRFE